MKRRIYIVAALAVFTLSGCGTIEGIGKDMQGMARWTQDKLDRGFDQEDTRRTSLFSD